MVSSRFPVPSSNPNPITPGKTEGHLAEPKLGIWSSGMDWISGTKLKSISINELPFSVCFLGNEILLFLGRLGLTIIIYARCFIMLSSADF